ncbi:amidase [Diplodia corticola]|uniref:Amidase n=1 Tax=Diplodia corticola TaxID=236234 RepID=A0A1J9QXD1_9PEZI|nr:amidase [Diplodia corticola]OJD33686.1 amidase [Diplodia corticola]
MATVTVTHRATGSELCCLAEATAEDLVQGLAENRFSSVDLVHAYVDRIGQVNAALRVVMEINPDAWLIAASLDVERARGRLRGPLHGIPVLLKGNIGTRDRMQTDAGSWALRDATPSADSTVAAKLRAAGLIILGKTSLTEWSMFRASNSSHGWNAVSGQAYGAYCPRQCPGGSSGGSAVAADLGLAWATLGTETSGSIVNPCSRNNVVGIKPTVGLTSRRLVVPVSEHQDTVGPIARSVKDAARLLQTIVGKDPHDDYTSASPYPGNPPDYVAACKPHGLQGKRIGIPRNVIDQSSDQLSHVMDAFDKAIAVIQEGGAVVVDRADFTAFSRVMAREYNPVTRADFAVNLPQYLVQLEHNPQGIHSLEHLRRFTRACPQEEFPIRDTRNWDTALERPISNSSAEFDAMYAENLYLGGPGGVEGALQRHQLDALVLPAEVSFNVAALVGTPIVSVPLGAAPDDVPVKRQPGWDEVELAPGIPFGISFLGSKLSEENLIEIAYAFEQMTRVRGTLVHHVAPQTDLRG